MSYLDKYHLRDSMYGDGIRDIRVNNTKRKVSSSFKDSPSYYSVTLNGSLIDTQIVDDSQTRDEKLLTTYYETPILSGSIIEWKSAADKWIVIHYDEMSEIYKRCRIRKCLGILKWLDSEGIVRQVDFTLSSPTTTNFGIEDGRVITIGNERRQLLIPKNEYTIQFKKDKRFIFDNRAWTITAVDGLTEGVLNLTVDESQIDPTKDNLELGIADYYGNEANYIVEVTNGESISISSGDTVQLNVAVKNNGSIVDKQIIYSTSDESIATVSSDGVVSGVSDGTVNVTASLVDGSVSDSISIVVTTTVEDNFTIEISGTPEIKNNQSKIFSATIWNNGAQVSGDVTWSIFADDKTSATTLATITSQTISTCTVKNNAANSGYVQLKATLMSDPNVVSWIRIQMKPLF